MICNSLGTSRYLANSSLLEWGGGAAYRAANRTVWSSGNPSAVRGWVQSGGGMTHVVVAGAGHMAPADQPEACFEMMSSFVRSGTRNNGTLPW